MFFFFFLTVLFLSSHIPQPYHSPSPRYEVVVFQFWISGAHKPLFTLDFSLNFFPQFWWRGALQRQRFTRLRRAAMVIQREARKKLENKHRKAARIQALIRGVLVRGRLNKMQDSALRIQVREQNLSTRRFGGVCPQTHKWVETCGVHRFLLPKASLYQVPISISTKFGK